MPALAGGILIAAASASARTLDLPIYDPARGLDRVPGYAADRMELTLRPGAVRDLAPGALAHRRSGIATLDALAGQLGGALFERMFPAEEAPPQGSNLPDLTRFLLVDLPAGADLAQALDRFAAVPEVEQAQPIPVMPVVRVPNDSLFGVSYWYSQPSDRDMDAPQAWDLTIGDPGVVVGIVDTGVLPWHPDLGGVLGGGFGNLWLNPGEVLGAPGVDDDGNLLVDDVRGWDFVNVSSVQTCEDGPTPDNDPSDFDGHGTMMAGLAAALTDNTRGVSGLAWNCRIMSLRAGWRSPSSGGLVRMDFCAQAIVYAVRKGAHVINCSWASANTNGLDAAVSLASRLGVVVVVAAGNNGGSNYLITRGDCVDVSATDASDQVPRGGFPWFWSANVGPGVDLCAPGHLITSTHTLGQTTPGCVGSVNADYDTGVGTSFSAPLVSGAVALIQSRRRELGRPPLHTETVRLRLLETADDISAQNPALTGQIGGGRLNVLRALTDPPTSWASRVGGRQVGGSVILPTLSGAPWVTLVTSNRRLLVLGGGEGDTVVDAALPAMPAGHLAAALISPGGEVGLFFGATNGTAHGYRVNGAPLPGWPRSAGGGVSLTGGPAVADLDGDGSPEVVMSGSDGQIYAWHAGGAPVAGFPLSGALAALTHPAVADLDGSGTREIVVGTADGMVFAWEADGTPRAGWPQLLPDINATAPVVGVLAAGGAPAVVVADRSGQVSAYGPDGIVLPGWPASLGATVIYDLALGDVMGDSLPEVVAVAGGLIHRLRGDGMAAAPAITAVQPPGAAPVLADVNGDGRAEIVVAAGSSLYAYDSTGAVLPGWPRRSGVGVVATVGEADQDGRAEVVAGIAVSSVLFNSDTTLYCYDAGAGSLDPAGLVWPTARGSFARTGAPSASALPVSDDVAPAVVTDLAVSAASETSLVLAWTAVGGDGLQGRAAAYDLRYSLLPITAGNFAAAIPVGGLAAPDTSGTPQSAEARPLGPGLVYYAALRVRDDAGNWSPLSNVVSDTTLLIPPAAVTDLDVAAVSESTVTLNWTAVGDNGLEGRAAAYDLRYAVAPIDAGSFDAAAPVAGVAAPDTSGSPQSATAGGLASGTLYYFALRVADAAGNVGPISNLAQDSTLRGLGPLSGIAGPALRVAPHPAQGEALFYYRGDAAVPGTTSELVIYDLTGRRVRRVALGSRAQGVFAWNGKDEAGSLVPAGVYFTRLTSGRAVVEARVVWMP